MQEPAIGVKMKSELLMGMSDGIDRFEIHDDQPSEVSEALNKRLVEHATRKSVRELSAFLDTTESDVCVSGLAQKYLRCLSSARSIGLIGPGSIDEADFLNFIIISTLINPDFYCESGVFIGSSLFAFVSACPEASVLAIDPDLSKIRLDKKLLTNVRLESELDFSQLGLHVSDGFVYFDDHINPASRILAAKKAGFSYMAIDDAAGTSSIVGREYPAVPAVPHIFECDLFSPGDSITWTARGKTSLVDRLARKVGIKTVKRTRHEFTYTEKIIEEMKEARDCISSIIEFPNLCDWVTPSWPRWSPYNKKYLIKLS